MSMNLVFRKVSLAIFSGHKLRCTIKTGCAATSCGEQTVPRPIQVRLCFLYYNLQIWRLQLFEYWNSRYWLRNTIMTVLFGNVDSVLIIWRCVYRASYCNVLMTNEMQNPYNKFLFHSFCLLYLFRTNLVVHHQEHGIIYCFTQFGTIGTIVLLAARLVW